ncbi:MAG: O-antigen ligase family protein [Lachnospiraceae bacterium]|nr:O-antigen ligase family protein [Lachnospiraceae bacterium]
MRIGQELKNSILSAFFLVMMIVYPLYYDARNGYQVIGDTKYYFFRNISILVVMALLLLVVFDVISQQIDVNIINHYRSLSGTDWFVYGYLLAVLLSYTFTAFQEEALWGAEGWHMGLISQLVFTGIYFFLSRYFVWKPRMLYAALIGSGLVFLLGILNRYSIYPITIQGQTPTFISTLGNINWFCGYWAVLCPPGVAFYWKSENKGQQIVAAIYTIIAFMSGVTQGSSSAYLALMGIFLFLFSFSFQENLKMKRFLELCFLFAISCQIARVMRYLPGLTLNYEKELGIVLTDSNVTLVAACAIALLYVLFLYTEQKRDFSVEKCKMVRTVVWVMIAFAFVGYVVLLIGNTCIEGGVFGLAGNSLFTFNNTYANSRGATWTSGVSAYQNLSFFKKLIGVGPDCFAEYIYAVPELAEQVYSQFGNVRLTNAHNEWLTVLVNTGALGLLSYAGIFVSAIWRFVKEAKVQPMLYLCAISVLAYTLHNMVSFQQILNTPYVFIFLGIGESFVREIYRVRKSLRQSLQNEKETVDK